ncbi:MAG: response regulator, partial [Flavobacteriaceae bacterium]|nr:response regulator [Flavobacteriaceae bacterium]
MEDDNFSSEFQVEAHDMLNDAEDALLGIESNPSPLDAYNIIFRSFHSVKGGAGMFHMTELADYMHKVETLFSHFKEQPEQIQGYITDYFLELIDNVRVLLAGEEISEDVVYNYDELMKINSTQGPETPAAVKPNLNLTEKKQEISQRVERTHKGVVFAIDDEKLILKVIKTFLEDSDFEVHCFDSPIEAIEKTKEMLPDLILSDYKMPQMNGLEMMKEIFKIDPDIPFIFLSAYLTKETMQDAMMHGVFNFLEKPIDETVLVHAVKNAITKRKSMELAYKSINHLVYHYYDLRE